VLATVSAGLVAYEGVVALSGKHADWRPFRSARRSTEDQPTHSHRRRSRRYTPLLCALGLAGVLIVAAGTTMAMGPASDKTSAATQRGASPAPVPGRSTDNQASRSELRALPAAASTSPSASPSPTKASPTPGKSKASPTQPSGAGGVSSSGSCGISYYGTGTTTANGEAFNPNAYTAASKTLAFNTRVRVTNPANGKSVVVRINDRGPYVNGRCLDLTTAAFAAIASLSSGVLNSAKWEVLSG
jgi:rare lipoprotein A